MCPDRQSRYSPKGAEEVWAAPLRHYLQELRTRVVGIRNKAESICCELRGGALGHSEVEGSNPIRNDARLLYPWRMLRLLNGLVFTLDALDGHLDATRQVSPDHDARARAEREVEGGALVALVWGATALWFGNYEHGLRSIATHLGKRFPDRASLVKTGRIIASSGAIPGSHRTTFIEHWDAARQYRNTIHGGGLHTQQDADVVLDGHRIRLRLGVAPECEEDEDVWLRLLEKSLELWRACVESDKVSAITALIPDLEVREAGDPADEDQ